MRGHGGGGVIGTPVVPSFTSASGVWRPSDAVQQQAGAMYGLKWPVLKDPNFSSVTLLLHFDDAVDASGSIPNRGSLGGVGAYKGPPALDATHPFPGTASSMKITTGTAQYCQFPANAGNVIGTGDFTAEVMVYWGSATQGTMWDSRSGSLVGVDFNVQSTGQIKCVGGSAATVMTSSTGALTTGGWHHIAWSRVSGTSYLGLDGSILTSAADAQNNSNNSGHTIGNGNAQAGIGTTAFPGWIAQARLTIGVGRYTSSYTVPGRFADY